MTKVINGTYVRNKILFITDCCLVVSLANGLYKYPMCIRIQPKKSHLTSVPNRKFEEDTTAAPVKSSLPCREWTPWTTERETNLILIGLFQEKSWGQQVLD